MLCFIRGSRNRDSITATMNVGAFVGTPCTWQPSWRVVGSSPTCGVKLVTSKAAAYAALDDPLEPFSHPLGPSLRAVALTLHGAGSSMRVSLKSPSPYGWPNLCLYSVEERNALTISARRKSPPNESSFESQNWNPEVSGSLLR